MKSIILLPEPRNVQRAGFEPTKRNGMQCEYLKYLLVAISARHHQFRHTTKPANRSSPLTTRTTLLNNVHYFTSWNKECASCGDRTHDHNIKSIALYH